MGTFTCRCGFLIPDSSYPNELAGTLYWQDEQEAVSSTAFEGVRAFLSAAATGRREAWLAFHFGADFPRFDDDADAIYQIYFKAGLDTGRSRRPLSISGESVRLLDGPALKGETKPWNTY